MAITSNQREGIQFTFGMDARNDADIQIEMVWDGNYWQSNKNGLGIPICLLLYFWKGEIVLLGMERKVCMDL